MFIDSSRTYHILHLQITSYFFVCKNKNKLEDVCVEAESLKNDDLIFVLLFLQNRAKNI